MGRILVKSVDPYLRSRQPCSLGKGLDQAVEAVLPVPQALSGQEIMEGLVEVRYLAAFLRQQLAAAAPRLPQGFGRDIEPLHIAHQLGKLAGKAGVSGAAAQQRQPAGHLPGYPLQRHRPSPLIHGLRQGAPVPLKYLPGQAGGAHHRLPQEPRTLQCPDQQAFPRQGKLLRHQDQRLLPPAYRLGCLAIYPLPHSAAGPPRPYG